MARDNRWAIISSRDVGRLTTIRISKFIKGDVIDAGSRGRPGVSQIAATIRRCEGDGRVDSGVEARVQAGIVRGG